MSPPVQSHPVDLWTIPLNASRRHLLSHDENARANRFRFEADRIRWARARTALREVLASYTGHPPEDIDFSYGEHGKPALLPDNELQFNLSHSGDFAMIAITRSIPVGVDIERIRPEVDIAALLRRLGETGLPQTTPELYQRWTAREARSKAAGSGLLQEPSPAMRAIEVAAPPGYAASVALSKPLAIMVSYRVPPMEA